MGDQKYILSGPPDPENITDGCQSLGEFILHRISQYGDSICHVSDSIPSKDMHSRYN